MFSDARLISPKLVRKRSSSLNTEAANRYRDNNIAQNKFQSKQMKKYASSGNLSNSDTGSTNKLKNKTNYDGYFLFVNWYKDFKSIKSSLLSIQDQNIFKNEFPRQTDINMKNYSSTTFLIINSQKIDNEYETFFINDYLTRLEELMNWAEKENKEFYDEIFKAIELITKQMGNEDEHQFLQTGDNHQELLEGQLKDRRSSEALIIQNKNQPIPSFLPREYQGQMNILRCACEFEIYYLSQDKKNERNYKSVPRIGVLSNQDINIFTKSFKLKDSYALKHTYLDQCSDTQIPNIDSCLRIGGPFGNDMIIRFQSPLTRNEWFNYVNDEINSYQETIKNSTTTITIFNDTVPSSSAPLVSRSITISGNTSGSSLKKMAMNTFEIKDIDVKDLSIVFLLKNKENVLHDDVSLIVLQEHANNVQENSCVKSCIYCDKGTAAVKIIYYLRCNRPLNESMNKGLAQTKKPVPVKPKQNKYNMNVRWIDSEMPQWLMNLLADLFNEGVECEGIFRMSGSVFQSDEYVYQISETDDLKIDTTIHNKANILKKFISIIEGSLLTSITKEVFYNLSNEINSIEDFLSQEDLQTKLLKLIQKIPANNLNLFQHILVILDTIIQKSQINQMNIQNISTCFSQNLFKHLSDDAMKINKLFECILHLTSKLVNPVTYSNIVKSYVQRKSSVGSVENHSKSNGVGCIDQESNSSTTSRTVSDSNEDKKPFIDQPRVPPRRKNINLHNRAAFNTPDESPDTLKRNSLTKKISLNDKQQSLSDELLTDGNNNPLDEVDSKLTARNPIDPILPVKSNSNLNQKPRRLSRSSNTFNASSPENVRLNESSNFYRQNQINRKHNKTNPITDISNSNTNNAKQNVNQLKTGAKLTRSTDRVITKARSRSQSKVGENVPSNTPRSNKTTYHFNANSSHDTDFQRKPIVERQRSSSACRVPKLTRQYESNLSTSKPPLPNKKNSIISEAPKVSKLVRDLEFKTTRPNERQASNVYLKPQGPIRPNHTIHINNAQELQVEKSSLSHPTNRFSLHEKLNDSNDEDVTYI